MTYFFNNFIKPFYSKSLLFFGFFGALGFLIDGFICQFLFLSLKLNLNYARVFSIFCSMNFSWILNRTFTFKTLMKKSFFEWVLYLSILAIGGTINYLTFLTFLSIVDSSLFNMWIAISLGSLTGLFFNFSLTNLLYKFIIN